MAETLQLIITAENKEALKAIEDLAKSTEGLKYKFQDVKKGTSEATNALVNFSRLAEDSAYGIRGAANNINPFIESFGRLKERAKESGKTITQELLPTLIGPAGISVAVSLISALYIKWSDAQNKAKKEAEALAKVNGKTVDDLKKQKDAIDDINSSIAKEVTDVSVLIAILNNENETRARKQDALEKLRNINPDIFNGLKLEGDAVIGLNAAYAEYLANIDNVIAVRIKQKELEAVVEQIVKNRPKYLTAEEKQIANIGAELKKGLDSLNGEDAVRRKNLQTQIESNKKAIENYELEQKKKKLLEEIGLLSGNIKITGNRENDDKVNNDGLDFNKRKLFIATAIKKRSILSGEDIEAVNEDTTIKDMEKSHQEHMNWLSKFYKFKIDLARKSGEENKKVLKEQQDAYESFAKQISSGVVNALQGLYSAMQQGDSFGKAFLDMLGKITEQLVAMVIQTLIFQAIMAALTGGTSAAAGAGVAASGIAGSAGRILMVPKYAEGGIVNKAHIGMVGEAGPEAIIPLSKLSGFLNTTFNAGAMSGGAMSSGGSFVLKGNDLVLALQRSNYSLNLRRGI